jgi:single-strand DNA-binding protein
MNETVLTLVGHVASEPHLRVTTTGARVGGFRLAVTERRFDKALSAWRDGDTIFWSVSCWRSAAENVVDSLEKGQPVVVHGRLRQRSFEKDGVHRTSLEIDAVTVGHDLTRGVATFTKATGPRREEFVDEEPATASEATRDEEHSLSEIGEGSANSAA